MCQPRDDLPSSGRWPAPADLWWTHSPDSAAASSQLQAAQRSTRDRRIELTQTTSNTSTAAPWPRIVQAQTVDTHTHISSGYVLNLLTKTRIYTSITWCTGALVIAWWQGASQSHQPIRQTDRVLHSWSQMSFSRDSTVRIYISVSIISIPGDFQQFSKNKNWEHLLDMLHHCIAA